MFDSLCACVYVCVRDFSFKSRVRVAIYVYVVFGMFVSVYIYNVLLCLKWSLLINVVFVGFRVVSLFCF